MMLLRFLESIGVRFDMDWDDEVTMTVPEAVFCADIEQALGPFGKQLSQQVRSRAQQQRSVFVGGQLNGQEVSDRTWGVRSGYGHRIVNGGGYGYWIRHRLKRGYWEVYEQVPDGRAFFRGCTTSERKARRGEITEQPSR